MLRRFDIESATPDNLQELVEFTQAAYADTYPNDRGITRDMFEDNTACADALEERLGKKLAEPSSKLLLVRENEDSIVGTGGLRIDEAEPFQAEIWGLYVAASRQGRGIGRRILNSLMNSNMLELVDKAWLYVATDCTDAKTMYENRGFEIVGYEDWDWPYWTVQRPHNQYWKMEKRLSEHRRLIHLQPPWAKKVQYVNDGGIDETGEFWFEPPGPALDWGPGGEMAAQIYEPATPTLHWEPGDEMAAQIEAISEDSRWLRKNGVDPGIVKIDPESLSYDGGSNTMHTDE